MQLLSMNILDRIKEKTHSIYC